MSKPTRGVVAYLEEQNPGKLRLVFDDVEISDKGSWRTETLYTHVDLDEGGVENGTLDPNLLQQIAENLLIRLDVHRKRRRLP
jgi:hypothetical protein